MSQHSTPRKPASQKRALPLPADGPRASRAGKALTPRAQRTRQELLDASEAVFGEKGFEGSSIADITQRAGVAQGTFYVYFPDKRAAFVELVRELSDRLDDAVLRAIDGVHDRMAIERARLGAFFDFVCRHNNLYRIVRQAEFVDEEVYRWYYRRVAAGIASGLARSMDQRRIRRADPEALAYCLMGVADFIGMRWALWSGTQPPKEVFEDVMTFIAQGLAPTNPASEPPRSPDLPDLPPQGRASKRRRGSDEPR